MRIWTFHPKYLDARGLVVLWREGLLAQAVLRGATSGYVHHPQLRRFRDTAFPVGFIAKYLRVVYQEATRRGYRFAAGKISRAQAPGRLTATDGQLEFEWLHFMKKLEARDPQWRAKLATVRFPHPHPVFRIIQGGVAPWEKGISLPNRPLQQTHRKRRAAAR